MPEKPDGVSFSPSRGLAQIGNAIGLISAAIAIYTSVRTSNVKEKLDLDNQALQERQATLESQLKTRTADLEEAKQRTSKYAFVHDLFGDLSSANPQRRDLTINLIRLTLSEDEASKFFTAFAQSGTAELREVGAAGVRQIETARTVLGTAADYEKQGFEYLANGDYEAAQKAFSQSESAYPSYHDAYELSKLLRSKKTELQDPAKRTEILKTIVTNYSYGAPPDKIAALKKKIQ